MTTKAHADFDPAMMGVRLAVVRDHGGGSRQVLQWEQPVVHTYTPDSGPAEDSDASWLRLPEEDARAIYEALADYFGHAGHDIRALRKDYQAERGRVDKLIDHLTQWTRA